VKCEKPNNDGLLGGCAVAKGGSGEKTQVRTARPKSGVPAMASTNGDEPGLSRSRDDFGAIPVPKHRCDHCGSATGITYPYDWPGRPDGILLHRRCEAPWFDNFNSRTPQPAPTEPRAATNGASAGVGAPAQPAPAEPVVAKDLAETAETCPPGAGNGSDEQRDMADDMRPDLPPEALPAPQPEPPPNQVMVALEARCAGHPPEQQQQVAEDAQRYLARWGEEAPGYGWSAAQQAALILQLHGREVQRLTGAQAVLGNKVLYRLQLASDGERP